MTDHISKASAVSKICMYNPARIARRRSFVIPFIFALLIGVACAFALRSAESESFTSGLAGSFAIIIALGVIAAFLFFENIRIRETSAFHALLRDALFELEMNSARLSDYLVDLDRRATRYFNCVTTSKVKAYFTLRYLDGSLKLLLADLKQRVDNPSPKNLVHALYLLKGNMPENNALGSVSNGEVQVVRVHELPAVLMTLIDTLENALTLIQEEIQAINHAAAQGKSDGDAM